MLNMDDFDKIRIALASPEQIRSWSSGEVKKPETINYRTLKPERDGLFCEKIFGPVKDWECHCGKYKKVRYKGIVCDRCGVEVTTSKVRRERMGHIELAASVAHIWFVKSIPSRIGLTLDLSPRSLERVLYFTAYIVTDAGDAPLQKGQLLTENEYRDYQERYGGRFKAAMGAEAIKSLLAEIEPVQLAQELRQELKEASGQKKLKIIRRLEIIETFAKSGVRPEWMILDVVPVIPPDLRPMVQLDGGRFATSDLNDLYRRVINRNNRLKRLLEIGAPDIIVRNEKRMLQEAVDALIDNSRRARPVVGAGNRPLKSLSDLLKGKQGRFRQNLLGKRVDYSGRSVIVVGPELKINQCGLPKEMALELFKPFIINKLIEREYAHNIKSAKRMVERGRTEVWDILEEIIQNFPVFLNRAPTLHRLGIQAFEPVLVEGRAIKLHPLVCTAYNADFDGDQMAVHIPLSAEAQAEALVLMMSSGNILNPKDGRPVTVPTQDIVLGCYYLTVAKEGAKGEGKVFSSYDEAYLAYLNDVIELQSLIKVRLDGEIVDTTLGRLIFNFETPIAKNLGFYNDDVGKKELTEIIARSYNELGQTKTAELLDGIKKLGYDYSTKAGITIGLEDLHIPEEKADIVSKTDEAVEKVEEQYQTGLISEEERYQKILDLWEKTTNKVTEALINSMDKFNPIMMMANSGARGNIQQIRQLAGMRGLMADPSGKIIDLPIKTNFKEGLSVLEYFISTHGARKGLADTALRTADSGYLTRRLVDVSQDVIIQEKDCGTTEGIEASALKDGSQLIESLAERIAGRYALEDIISPQGELFVAAGEMISDEQAKKIEEAGIKKVKIRSVLTCRSRHGVCARCYGRNMALSKPIEIGEAVGIIAAQSIGEPGTQLTMRTFHVGGVAGEDITQGLPRVEELFEARKPKGQAAIAETGGIIEIKDLPTKREVRIIGPDGEERASYQVPFGLRLKVRDGDEIEAGDELTEGSVNPHELLKIKGLVGAQIYLLREVQKVYRLQGVDINDKHLEVIIRQMSRKVKVDNPGDTDLLPGNIVERFEFEDKNAFVEQNGGQPATAKPILLGITKISLATNSFLSAASFQETTRVLTDAAIKAKEDSLIGLKENVIIGKLIPAGSGLKMYRNLRVEPKEKIAEEEEIGVDTLLVT